MISSHLGRYIYGDKDGNFKGDAEMQSPDTTWSIEPQSDGTWALKSAAGYYVHGTGDNLTCFQKELPGDGRWVVHLAMHPQINLTNEMRKRWVHLEDGELHCTEDIPWGEDALINLVFFGDHPCGRYGLMASNGKYLSANGSLVDSPSDNCKFLLGFHDANISFRDESGNYLSCIGAKAVLKVKTGSDKVTKDELFSIKDSEPQFTIIDTRGKYVSVRGSEEIKADQPDITDMERFQLEVIGGNKVYILTNRQKYATVNSSNTVVAADDGKNSVFTVEYHGNRVKFIAPNGKYVTVKPNGSLIANGGGDDASSSFILTLDNRPSIFLRGQYGFIGSKGASGRLECGKAKQEVYKLICEDGTYSFQSGEGKYWGVDGDGAHQNDGGKTAFHLEFTERSMFLIKHVDTGKYLQGEQNGA